MGEFVYQSEVNYAEIDAKDNLRVIPLLEPFKKGLMRPLEGHILNADGLRKYLMSPTIGPEIRSEFRLKSKVIEDELMAIVRAYSELERDVQPRQLEMTAQRDYYNYFNDHEMEQGKLEFIMLLKTYEHLKTFNNIVYKSWKFLQSTFEDIKVTSTTRSFLEQVLTFKIYPRLELCELTDLLLRRLAYILQITTEEEKNDRVVARGKYTSLLKYSFAAIYRDDLEKILTESPPENKGKKTFTPQEIESPVTEDSCIKDPFFLDSRGQELFNQSLLYTLKINPDRQRMEEQKIRKAVYIETHIGAEETAVRQDLIRKFISQAKSKNRLEEYRKFLYEYFDFVKDMIYLQVNQFSPLEKTLLLYHLGPVYFLKIVLHFMREGRTGFIHRHLRQEQMIRELPFEHLKFILKDWWNEKIYTQLSRNERNSREYYQKIVEAAKQIWQREAPKTLEKITRDPALSRAYEIHDVRFLKKFLEQDLSIIGYSLLIRFLGPDFIYMPVLGSKKALGS
ncbi:MAG: hypothetical protein NZM25_05190 [Leptospiraceae bacterium]|nr:hypothetical protein [Leptospiraceae bacterium]MDW8305597.1 hypothetical protein [Leptospiraceae bacterium]